MAGLSTLALYDDLRRCQGVLCDGLCEEEFLKFVRLTEEFRAQWQGAISEAQRIQRELDLSLQKMADLETKLFHARRLLEMENKARREAENERDLLEKKIISVADLLKNETDIREETRDKLAFLNSFHKNRKSFARPAETKPGNDINSTGSLLSDLSLTQSEDDFLEVLPGKTWKRHRPSQPKSPTVRLSGKKSRISSDGKRNQRSSKVMEIGPHDKIVAQTKVTIPQNIETPIQAESIIEAIPQGFNNENIDNNVKSPKRKTPMKTQYTPSAPPLYEANIKNTPTTEFKTKIRNHNFASKTFIKSDVCCNCQKRIRFGSVAFKCRECRVCAHQDCKDSISLACVPQSAGTPNQKTSIGYLSDYAPPSSPKIPALIVHCVNEIEARGLKELGIYRVCGSERDIKALKARFLRGKSIPFLGNIDVHVLSGCIKDFLRSFNEPLIPTSLWKDFCNAAQNTSEEDVQNDLIQAIEKLPQPNRDTLAFLLLHFQRISNHEENKMTLNNIAKIFGPTIVGYSKQENDHCNIYMEIMMQISVMEKLLNIPVDYWGNIVYNQPQNGQNNFFDNDEKLNSCKSYYGSPLIGSAKSTTKKKHKFYATPPYSSKKKI